MNIKTILVLLLFLVAVVGIIAPVNATVDSITSKDKIYSVEFKEKSVKYKITFDANGGKISSSKAISTNIKKGTKIKKFPTPKRSGYIFNGWYTKKSGGTKISKSTKPRNSITYYAQWKDTPGTYEKKLKSLIKDNSISAEAKNELIRILKIQLQNPEILNSIIKNKIKISVIPIGMFMTDLPEFKGLVKASTFDGRSWKYVRGVSYVPYKGNIYVGVGEENLIGEYPQIESLRHSGMQERYHKGYSVTTHELAHTIHYYILSQNDKNIIKDCYKKTKSSGNWVDGPGKCYASENEREYFAQLSNAYLGTNNGYDPTTNNPRNNGKEWVKNNDIVMYNLLKKIYKNGEVNDIYPDGSLKEGGKITNDY